MEGMEEQSLNLTSCKDVDEITPTRKAAQKQQQ